MTKDSKPATSLFPLGRIVITPGAQAALARTGQTPREFLRHHASGDWGEIGTKDAAENELALREGLRLLSAYRTSKGDWLVIITEADRSVTTLLLSGEY